MMPPKLGILAGGGELPGRIIQTCSETGRAFFVIAFEGHTDPESIAGTQHAWVRLGAAGKALDLLRQAGVEELVLAGHIRRPSFVELMPDMWAAKIIAKAGPAAFGDDGLLSAVVRALENEEGFRVVGADTLMPDMLAPEGVYGAHHPDELACRDIRRGMTVARGLGALDVGQAAVIQEGLVLAVEAVEGTDSMLQRCGALRREGKGGVLVKVKKPGQESRADLPTIGVSTVREAAKAGLAGIAVEAGNTLVIDHDGIVDAADEMGLFIVGIVDKGETG